MRIAAEGMPVPKRRLYPIVFGVVLAVACSTLLKTLDAALGSRIERNRTYDRRKNVVLVFVGRDEFARMDQRQIEAVYKEKTEEVAADGEGIAYYRYMDPATGKAVAYAFPLEGMGLWDKVKGLMAVEPDLNTVRGVSFYEQAETPGLGGRIGEAEWASRFDGKKLADATGSLALQITKAGAADPKSPNQIDGITAATMTGDAVNRLMQASAKRFLEKVKS
ncbi:MAG: FMN-binding protein [Planctomycetota bacterium]